MDEETAERIRQQMAFEANGSTITSKKRRNGMKKAKQARNLNMYFKKKGEKYGTV